MRLVFLALLTVLASPVLAQGMGSVDLILPPALESPDAPFYRGATVKVGADVMPVVEGQLPNGVAAQYMPDDNKVVVSNDNNISENRKGQALMDIVTALQAANVATAAGTEE